MAQSLLRGRNVYKQIFRALHVEINGRHSILVQPNGTPLSRTLSTAVHKRFNFSPMLRLNEFRRSCVSFFSQRKVLSSGTSLNLPSVKQIEQFLSSRRIPFEHGHTSIVVGCTSCSMKEKEKSELSMYINKTTGSHFCKNCGRSGSWRQFKVMVSEPNSDKTSNASTEHALSYNPPLTNSSEADDKAIQLWNESVSLTTSDDHDRIEDQFNIKNLSKESIDKYQVHIAEHKFSEPEGTFKEYKCIVFPWYDSKKSAVHGVKLVRVDRENDTSVSLQPRLGVLGLFGWNTVPSDAKEVVLTLNEFDAIAVHQATSYPAVSLPLGTHSLPPEVLPQLEQFQRIILWFGDDVRSRQAANQFSKKLSIQRCHIVRSSSENAPTGPLDALNKGLDLQELLTSSKPISHEKIATFQELRTEVYSELVNADQVAGVKWSRFPKLSGILKGHRRGELTIFTGPTGAGKTTLLSEMSVDLCQQGVNTLWGSFEIRNVRLAKIMMNQFSGLDLQKNVQQFNYWADKFEMLPMYYMCFYGSQNISTVIETMAHAVYVFDIDHVVIDNLQFMTSNMRAEDRFSIQNHAISALRNFASSKNVHVTLVIHPRKENDDVELQTASIFGTAKASQEADNVLILQDKKGKGEKYLQVTKNRFDGTVGRVPLEFVKASLSMCGFGKKDVTFKRTNKPDKRAQITASKVVSDIDMISISNTPPIEKASFTTPRARLNLEHPGDATSKSSYTSGNTETVKTDVRPSSLEASVNYSFPHGVRTFQGSMKDSIRSKTHRDVKGPIYSGTEAKAKLVGSSGKSRTEPNGGFSLSKAKDTRNPAPTKLYSKAVDSLVAKYSHKYRAQEKKMAALGRMKTTSSSSSKN